MRKDSDVIKDMQHMTIFDNHQREIYDTLAHFNARASGLDDKAELIQIYLAQTEALKEIVRKHERSLRFMNGEKVEPEHHYVEAQLIGKSNLEML
jgi:hypothetical protein